MSGVPKADSMHLHYQLQYREEEDEEESFPASMYYSDAIDAIFCTNLCRYRDDSLYLL